MTGLTGHRCSAILPLVLFAAIAGAQTSQAHWGYGAEGGPGQWGGLDSSYASCSLGHSQSPINITGAKLADLPPLRFDYHPVPLDIVDNGHSIQVNYAAGSTLTVGDKTYTLKQFHFHHPSEEHVNGRRYEMVAHLVHADAEGHTAVVAVFLKRGHENAFLETVWKNIPAVKEKDVDVSGVALNLQDLLPADRRYYSFTGP